MGSTATAAPERTDGKTDVTVVEAHFVASAPAIVSLPAATHDEVAFIGRSNVGKSSLLNALMARRDRVRTSRTPGQTRTVNLFGVLLQLRRRRRELTLVDLPGYGFAKMSHGEKARVSRLLSDYVSRRDALRCIVQLFDLRHDPTAQDKETFRDLQSLRTRTIVVATKADQVPLAKRKARATKIAAALAIDPTTVVLFSAETKLGRAALWNRILPALTEDDGSPSAT